MLSGNYLTFYEKSLQSGGSPFCRLCSNLSEPETLEHLISRCGALTETRNKILNEMKDTCMESELDIDISTLSDAKLTQFLLDPSSLNLEKRVNITHPCLPKLFQISRDLIKLEPSHYCSRFNPIIHTS